MNNIDTKSYKECCEIVIENGGIPKAYEKDFFKKGFVVRFKDLTEEAKSRYCSYIGSDMDDDWLVATDIRTLIYHNVINEDDLKTENIDESEW